jgi:starch-binding outer membrane protein, SusD/RagB family
MYKTSNMKSLKIILMILPAMLITFACNEDNLDLQPLTETEANYFDEEIDYERSMVGLYSKLADHYTYNNNNWMHEFFLLPGDEITSNNAYEFEVFSTLQPGNGDLNRAYDLYYQLVNRANTFLEKIRMDEDREESVYSSTTTRDNHEGEALFLRGFANFMLWNYFGTSPVITERIATQDAINPPSSDGIALLDQAISDFTGAADLLPAEWAPVYIGRATKSAANGFLGKALVFKASWLGDNALYNQAVSAFDKITDKSLVDNYRDNFSIKAENNEESLFESQASQPTQTDNVWLSNDDFTVIGTMSTYYGFYEGHWSFWDGTPWIATDKLVSAIDPDDPRLTEIVDTSNNKIRKYVIENQLTDTGVGSLNNFRILRYADILLLKAEALNETGNQNGAVALINQVRTRARNMGTTGEPADLASGASMEQVRQWIMDERLIELAGEGQRWLDLRRWHKAGYINLENFDFSSNTQSFNIQMPKHLLYPIPTGEVDLNQNVTQNPGY